MESQMICWRIHVMYQIHLWYQRSCVATPRFPSWRGEFLCQGFGRRESSVTLDASKTSGRCIVPVFVIHGALDRWEFWWLWAELRLTEVTQLLCWCPDVAHCYCGNLLPEVGAESASSTCTLKTYVIQLLLKESGTESTSVSGINGISSCPEQLITTCLQRSVCFKVHESPTLLFNRRVFSS